MTLDIYNIKYYFKIGKLQVSNKKQASKRKGQTNVKIL